MGLLTDLLGDGNGTTGLAFSIPATAEDYSHVNWAVHQINTARWLCHRRYNNSSQDSEIVYALPSALAGGTWNVTLHHYTGTSLCIYHIAVSDDAANWTELGTVDGYAATGAAARSTLEDVNIEAGVKFIRVKAATKNASSSSYFGEISLLSGARVGA